MSDGFSADWLTLREPYDLAARSNVLLDRLAAWHRRGEVLRVVDLGAGTGSNLRCIAPALGGEQEWILAELDPSLIATGQARLAATRVGWRYRQLDLARDLEQLADRQVDLITASALIDLVGEPWLRRLVAWRASADAALHIVLTYDGRTTWEPADAGDDEVTERVNRHQHGDKGFGAALGGRAVPALRTLLADARGELLVEASDWDLSEDDRPLQAAMVDGYAKAATQIDSAQEAADMAWAIRRHRHIAAGRSRLRVGHLDLLFLPQR